MGFNSQTTQTGPLGGIKEGDEMSKLKCSNCKHFDCSLSDEPCKHCLSVDTPFTKTANNKWEATEKNNVEYGTN